MAIGLNTNQVLTSPAAIALNIEWTPDRRICIFQPIITHPLAIGIWHDAVYETMMDWPLEKPCRILHDFSLNKRINVTSRLKMNLLRQFLGCRDLQGRVAILLQRTVGTEAVELFCQVYMLKSLAMQVFYERHEAMAWLYAQSLEGSDSPTSPHKNVDVLEFGVFH